MGKATVIFVGGFSRNGSTVLGRLLGSVEGCVNVGEALYTAYGIGSAQAVPCACGQKPNGCQFWSDLFGRRSGSAVAYGERLLRLRAFPSLLWQSVRNTWPPPLNQFVREVRGFYEDVVERTGKKVIIDTSKHPSYGVLLGLIPEFDVYYVHLVRDPAGVVASYSVSKGYVERLPLLKVILYWMLFNIGVGALKWLHRDRYLRMRYEDFVRDPEMAIGRVLALAKIGEQFVSMDRVLHGSTECEHSLGGNPDKLAGGIVEVARREFSLSWGKRRLVNILTWPLRASYGYTRIGR